MLCEPVKTMSHALEKHEDLFETNASLDLGGYLASANTHIKQRRSPAMLLILLAIVAVIGALTLTITNAAQGANEADTSTIGVGDSQSASDSQTVAAADRIKGLSAGASSDGLAQVSDVPSEAVTPTDASPRSITVKDPDPVVVPVAVDYSNPTAVEKAREVCTLDPLPTAPRIAPDVHDGTWLSGVASAYNVATNDDGKGNFGVSTTASGVSLHGGSITVAVPESKSYLLGRIIEICYQDKVVIATVTDTGSFAKYGRSLDLAPGVYNALGASSVADWGTRTVYYRFL